MVNIDKLRGIMREKRLNVEEMADLLGIDRATLYRKLNASGETFTIREANEIVRILSLTKEQADSIFFASIVA